MQAVETLRGQLSAQAAETHEALLAANDAAAAPRRAVEALQLRLDAEVLWRRKRTKEWVCLVCINHSHPPYLTIAHPRAHTDTKLHPPTNQPTNPPIPPSNPPTHPSAHP